MPDYRIYMIKNGHIAAGYDFRFETDEQARSNTRSMLGGNFKKAEVWLEAKRISVEVFDADSGPDGVGKDTLDTPPNQN